MERQWKKSLTDGERNVMQEIVDQIPTTMGLRDRIEDIFDKMVGGARKNGTISPEDAYKIYEKAQQEQGCTVDDFDDLEPNDQHAWGQVAQAMSPPEFQFVVCKDGDVTGTNDEQVARAIARDAEEAYVVDVFNQKWVLNDQPYDDNDIVEL